MSLIIDPGISHATMRVYATLASFADARGQCFPSLATIARRASCSKTTVKRELAWLEESWYISRERRTGRRSTFYTLTMGKVIPFPGSAA